MKPCTIKFFNIFFSCLGSDYKATDNDVSQKYTDSKLFLPRTLFFVYSNETLLTGCHDAWRRFACLTRFPRCNSTTLETAGLCRGVCQDYLNQCWWKLTYQSYYLTFRQPHGAEFCNRNSVELGANVTFCSRTNSINMSFPSLVALIITLYSYFF
jgi:hypothetical protein